MADNKEQFHGIDGKVYDNVFDMARGNTYAWMEKEKAEDLKKQNRLIEENNKIQREIAQQNYEMEMLKENNKKIEMEQQRSHEKEMRILKLFDDIGISNLIFSKYIENNYVFKPSKKLYSLKNTYDEVTELINGNMLVSDISDDSIKEKIAEIINSSDKKISNNVAIKIKELKAKTKPVLIVSSLLCIVFLIIIFIGMASNPVNDTLFFMGSIPFLFMLTFIGIRIYSISEEKEKIKSQEDSPSIYYMPEIKKQVLDGLGQKVNDVFNNELKVFSKSVETCYSKFYDFRINHYNPKIEKFLLDLDFHTLLNEYSIKHKTVNNSNKKKNGKIEDYITFFESNS